MYQTVGHDGIECYAECMDLPLFRAPISGTPVDREYEYKPTKGDEVEDLLLLLQRVQAEIPDIKGVSVGAIHSNYQRIRVENVCARLGLQPLAYLWGREQQALLAEMIDRQMHCILIKVAVMGLNAAHLGKTLKEMYPVLCDLQERCHINVCGEGGEYESFTLDCPLFKKRMVVEESKTVLLSKDTLAPVAYLQLKIRVEPK